MQPPGASPRVMSRWMQEEGVWSRVGGHALASSMTFIHSFVYSFIHQWSFIDHPLGAMEQPDQSKNDQLLFRSYPGPRGHRGPNQGTGQS